MNLGEVIEINRESIKRNFPFKTISYFDISSVGEGILNEINEIEVESSPSRAKRIVKNRDTIISTVRPANRSFYYCKNIKENSIASTGFAVLTPINDLINSRYLYYLVTDKSFTAYLVNHQKGSTYPAFTIDVLENKKVNLPPLQTQKRIADILSAYDDLIENNLMRINLLEQAAQNIYKEWFVHLRFPGHENTPINEETGLPEGWEEKALGEFTEIKKGKNITKSTIKEGNVPVVAGGLKPAYYHNTSNTSNPVITVSASGANAGYVNMYLEDIWASDCSYIDSNLSDSVFFIHNLLLNQQELIFGMQRGAAQPHVYPKDLKRAEFVIPYKGLIQKFEEQVSAQYDMKRVLLNQNQKLKAARDILLPRLMNRTIEV